MVPFFLVEENLVGAMEKVAQSSGFRMLPPNEAIAAASSPSPIHSATVLGFPSEPLRAREETISLMNTFRPSAVIVIEKGGMNEKGIVHTGRGHDTTKYMAKVDFLIEEAMRRKVWTLGIGDGGNEIGMGNIREEIIKSSLLVISAFAHVVQELHLLHKPICWSGLLYPIGEHMGLALA